MHLKTFNIKSNVDPNKLHWSMKICKMCVCEAWSQWEDLLRGLDTKAQSWASKTNTSIQKRGSSEWGGNQGKYGLKFWRSLIQHTFLRSSLTCVCFKILGNAYIRLHVCISVFIWHSTLHAWDYKRYIRFHWSVKECHDLPENHGWGLLDAWAV